mmetsp:Transcript_74792/g.198536  ORF Transcript_74792/g.198536 Transcript_74792/m.198536 type:complete len:213 (-) Transcript_74792:54-692(-)
MSLWSDPIFSFMRYMSRLMSPNISETLFICSLLPKEASRTISRTAALSACRASAVRAARATCAASAARQGSLLSRVACSEAIFWCLAALRAGGVVVAAGTTGCSSPSATEARGCTFGGGASFCGAGGAAVPAWLPPADGRWCSGTGGSVVVGSAMMPAEPAVPMGPPGWASTSAWMANSSASFTARAASSKSGSFPVCTAADSASQSSRSAP